MERIGSKAPKKVIGKEAVDVVELSISEEIQKQYADIGREVVANAIRLAQDHLLRLKDPKADDFNKLVVSVPVWVTGIPDMRDPSRLSHVCCVCCREDSGVIICRGDCC